MARGGAGRCPYVTYNFLGSEPFLVSTIRQIGESHVFASEEPRLVHILETLVPAAADESSRMVKVVSDGGVAIKTYFLPSSSEDLSQDDPGWINSVVKITSWQIQFCKRASKEETEYILVVKQMTLQQMFLPSPSGQVCHCMNATAVQEAASLLWTAPADDTERLDHRCSGALSDDLDVDGTHMAECNINYLCEKLFQDICSTPSSEAEHGCSTDESLDSSVAAVAAAAAAAEEEEEETVDGQADLSDIEDVLITYEPHEVAEVLAFMDLYDDQLLDTVVGDDDPSMAAADADEPCDLQSAASGESTLLFSPACERYSPEEDSRLLDLIETALSTSMDDSDHDDGPQLDQQAASAAAAAAAIVDCADVSGSVGRGTGGELASTTPVDVEAPWASARHSAPARVRSRHEVRQLFRDSVGIGSGGSARRLHAGSSPDTAAYLGSQPPPRGSGGTAKAASARGGGSSSGQLKRSGGCTPASAALAAAAASTEPTPGGQPARDSTSTSLLSHSGRKVAVRRLFNEHDNVLHVPFGSTADDAQPSTSMAECRDPAALLGKDSEGADASKRRRTGSVTVAVSATQHALGRADGVAGAAAGSSGRLAPAAAAGGSRPHGGAAALQCFSEVVVVPSPQAILAPVATSSGKRPLPSSRTRTGSCGALKVGLYPSHADMPKAGGAAGHRLRTPQQRGRPAKHAHANAESRSLQQTTGARAAPGRDERALTAAAAVAAAAAVPLTKQSPDDAHTRAGVARRRPDSARAALQAAARACPLAAIRSPEEAADVKHECCELASPNAQTRRRLQQLQPSTAAAAAAPAPFTVKLEQQQQQHTTADVGTRSRLRPSPTSTSYKARGRTGSSSPRPLRTRRRMQRNPLSSSEEERSPTGSGSSSGGSSRRSLSMSTRHRIRQNRLSSSEDESSPTVGSPWRTPSSALRRMRPKPLSSSDEECSSTRSSWQVNRHDVKREITEDRKDVRAAMPRPVRGHRVGAAACDLSDQHPAAAAAGNRSPCATAASDRVATSLVVQPKRLAQWGAVPDPKLFCEPRVVLHDVAKLSERFVRVAKADSSGGSPLGRSVGRPRQA